jgi:hypothetical protein
MQKIASAMDLSKLKGAYNQKPAISVRIPHPNEANALLRTLTLRLASLLAQQDSGVDVWINAESDTTLSMSHILFSASCSVAHLSDRTAIECHCSLASRLAHDKDEDVPSRVLMGLLVEIPQP